MFNLEDNSYSINFDNELGEKKLTLQEKESPPASRPWLFSPEEVFRDEILSIDVAQTTPLEALNRIARWQNELSE